MKVEPSWLISRKLGANHELLIVLPYQMLSCKKLALDVRTRKTFFLVLGCRLRNELKPLLLCLAFAYLQSVKGTNKEQCRSKAKCRPRPVARKFSIVGLCVCAGDLTF